MTGGLHHLRIVAAGLFLAGALVMPAQAVERDDCLLGDGEQAVKACRVLLNGDPADLQVILALAELYKFDQRYEEEIDLLEDAKTRYPDNKRIHELLEIAHSNRDEQEFARKLREADKDAEVEVSLRVEAIRCRTRQGEAAVKSCDRVLKAEPDNVTALVARGEALLELSREDDAVADFRRALDLEPDNKATELKLAVLTRSNQPDQTTSIRGLGDPAVIEKKLRETIVFGRFVALVIGNNDYEFLPDLKSARGDAAAVAAVLEKRYGFETILLENATRYDILKALSNVRKSLKTIDNLLIYYAGHGVLDEAAEQGYWLPVDAEEDIKANWISNADLTDMLRAIDARHALVVADSCFSGSLVRAAPAVKKGGGDRAKLLLRLGEKVSRTVMTSGGVEPVLDSGGGRHSVFAKAFLDALRENNQVVEGEELFRRLRTKVVVNADQTPEYSDVRKAGHDGGDFIFIPKSTQAEKSTSN